MFKETAIEICLLISVFLLTTVTTHADVVFNNFGPNDVYHPEWYYAVSYHYDEIIGEVCIDTAMAFTPVGNSYILDKIELALSIRGGNNEIDVWLMDDNGNKPGTIIEAIHLSGAVPDYPGIYPPVEAISSLNPTLIEGVRYWVVVSTPGPDDTEIDWHHNTVGYEGFGAQRLFIDGVGDWNIYSDFTCTFRVIATEVNAVTMIYVDANATGDNNGSSWEDAYKYLQNALWAAGPGTEIWVAEGTYRPDEDTNHIGGTNDRTATFQLKNGVAIYGGFPSGGGPWISRNPSIHETILSGDLNGDDEPNFVNNGENSYHVVTGSGINANTILNGFTITAGNADEPYPSPNGIGGGMYNYLGSPMVVNCTFSGNSAVDVGGGMGNHNNSGPTVTNCTFRENWAAYDGGGMDNSNSSPTVTNCALIDNTATYSGGGISNYDSSSPTLTNCTFSGNSASEEGGGGIYNEEYSSPTVTNCTFSGNWTCAYGGGMFNYNSGPILINCTFIGNEASGGGGMWNNGSNPAVTNCSFIGNSAVTGYGGGMRNISRSSPMLTNCTFSGNSSYYDGAGIANNDSNSTVTNCTFTGNSTQYHGGGIYNSNYSRPTLANCILWGNIGSQIYNEVTSYLTISYCDVQGGWAGTGNIDENPLFVDADGLDDIIGTEDDNLRLSADSPCIDAADNYAVPEEILTDLDGLSRFFDDPTTTDTGNGTPPIVDMGAYEYRPIIYVDANAAGGNGSSWEDAYKYLQNALWAAEPGYEIWVAQGTYRPDEQSDIPGGSGDRNEAFLLESGISIYGGFPTGGGGWSSRDPKTYKTILSGDLDEDDVYVSDPCNLLDEPTRAENSYHVVLSSYVDATAILDGFIIEAGNANSGGWPNSYGGGMFNDVADCTVSNCTFVENASEDGGAMYNYQSNLHIGDCTFLRNAATNGGGGIDFYQSNHPVLVNCDFISNKAYASGSNAGGLYNIESSPEVNNCSFSNNSAQYGGGISNVNGSSPIITNCIFSGNSAESGGGINDWNSTSTTLTNCTFNGNSASVGGGGMCVGLNCYATLTDCNFSGNSAADGGGMVTWGASVVNIGAGGSVSILDGLHVSQNSQIRGTGSVVVGLGGGMVVDSNAVVDLNDPNEPDITGAIQCDGLLKVRDNGCLTHADVNISRQAGGFFGKFRVEGSAQVRDVNIYADGDRFIDVDPCTFTGTIANNRIYVTITEGRNKTPEGILDVRGRGLNEPNCFDDPNVLACHLDSNDMPPFDTNSWTLERLVVAPGAKVTLVDRFSSGNGDPEVLYVKHLALGNGCVLNVGFERLYYMNLTGDLDSIKKGTLFGFSLNKIDFDNYEEFESRVGNNNFIHPDPNYNRIHIERVMGLQPDPKGMMIMRNLEDEYGQMVFARAKGEFAPAVEDEIRIRFNYMFNTTDPNAQIVVYLSDMPEMEDVNDTDHYIEVAQISAPLAPRPGSADSGRFGNFEKYVSTGELDLSKGTWIELKLIEPVQGPFFGCSSYKLMGAADSGEGASTFVDDIDAGVYCYWGVCLDLSGEDGLVTEADFLIVVSGAGSTDAPCLDGSFSGDGYADAYDIVSWDWTMNLDRRKNLCGQVPLSEGGVGGLSGYPSSQSKLVSLSGLKDLLIAGKRGTKAAQTKLKDRLYVFDINDSNAHYTQWLNPVSERCNIRIVRGVGDDLYQINSENGVSRLDETGTPIVPPGQPAYDANEPRYNRPATVYVVVQEIWIESELYFFGRPIFDAAFDTNFVYVVPVVVVPDGNEPYTAAAKLQLDPISTPPYHVVKLYDGPLLSDGNDNQCEYRNTLREIELDAAGNVYVTNANIINESDILWKFEPNGAVHRLDLDLAVEPCYAPTGMCVSSTTNVLYLASSVYNKSDPNSTVIHGFSTETLAPVRTITVSGMQHVTSITEDPTTNSLWVAGFNFNSTPPDPPNPYVLPFYDPYLAKVPPEVNNVSAVCILDANYPEYDLAMPLSIVWTGELCGGADLNRSGTVSLPDLAILARYWLDTNCGISNNCEGADLEPQETPDGDVDLKDLDILVEHWLDTGCLGP